MFRGIHFRRSWRYIYINSKNFTKLPQRSYNVYTQLRHTPLTALRNHYRYLSTDKFVEHIVDSVLDQSTYEKVCATTLDALNEYMERLVETVDYLPGSDIGYSDGVLTVNLGPKHGVYVINRQTPNRQIWLSSPFSGPKRYDFVGPKTGEKGKWLYRHDDETLHDLLQQELQPIFKDQKHHLLLEHPVKFYPLVILKKKTSSGQHHFVEVTQDEEETKKQVKETERFVDYENSVVLLWVGNVPPSK